MLEYRAEKDIYIFKITSIPTIFVEVKKLQQQKF
jgi:hypothetical protein